MFETLRELRVLESWTAHVDRLFKPLPQPITAVFRECRAGRSRYESEGRRILICYEEADRSYAVLNGNGAYADRGRLMTAWMGSLLHALYHELAHGLADLLALPLVGREEDGADQFAVIAVLGHPEGATLALGAADYLRGLANVEAEIGLDPSSAHPFLAQRYYNVLCLSYGANPQEHEFLVEEGRLPAMRAQSCKAEYMRAAYGWATLLQAAAR